MVDQRHLQEIRSLCPGLKQLTEGGVDYVLLPALRLPDGCTPCVVDCLLVLGSRDGYDTRLYFSQVVTSPQGRNWNSQNIRILERNWFAYSWRIPTGLRPIETLLAHLQALR
ncbi:MAG: hypothetical protein EPN47_05000 [Acidobacteria bacterium]|nr:MAG: hypothetical protein EPN47_05000 [Acidobacteriota bacterium]